MDYILKIGESTDRELVGGKGASLSAMQQLGLNVPPGFTITTQAWRDYDAGQVSEEALWKRVVVTLDEMFPGLKSGEQLISVRSGAPLSMPGMMSTVINVGATKGDSPLSKMNFHRSMLCALGVSESSIADKIETALEEAHVFSPKDLGDKGVDSVLTSLKELYGTVDVKLPISTVSQAKLAMLQVFKSWDSERAQVYRAERGIDRNIGTAVTFQLMVNGLHGGSGVYLTRQPSTGEPTPMIDWVKGGQGDDVVSGLVTPLTGEQLKKARPLIYEQLIGIGARLEQHYGDAMDIEFTFDGDALYILQCRTMKRTPTAACRILVDLALEGLVDRQRFLSAKVEPIERETIQLPAGLKAWAAGLPVVGKHLVGQLTMSKTPEPGKIVVRKTTSTDDLPHMINALAVITMDGGPTCHAALVARDFNVPTIVSLAATHGGAYISNGISRLGEGATVTLTPDGCLYEGKVDLTVKSELDPAYQRYLRLKNFAEG